MDAFWWCKVYLRCTLFKSKVSIGTLHTSFLNEDLFYRQGKRNVSRLQFFNFAAYDNAPFSFRCSFHTVIHHDLIKKQLEWWGESKKTTDWIGVLVQNSNKYVSFRLRKMLLHDCKLCESYSITSIFSRTLWTEQEPERMPSCQWWVMLRSGAYALFAQCASQKSEKEKEKSYWYIEGCSYFEVLSGYVKERLITPSKIIVLERMFLCTSR